ncbi:MAG: polyribonucleotide nucleotidyltransferase [Omnitrophica WOR_2 bacterium GWF2_38_59]|nr:MAG: polyribonucleotide nucleotidyltransferase [Omnitrophica WOR_2 bacterium GWF2_38_59]OGX50583.1 MAG: polyribonucleotide nucleotidyltransferase [Omnitrophica WOR_2 bacterium RIFOXYA12_FULL_38_10]OGX51100.1 MAG: polyribonucleotide nucleotidyltransferase [Omnitrophica WOR_2 bacterium RIFOXYA2_FULL_38_17]OGX60424.1 MAG: polyribonucleotide nucleotidyltransferase [Omnitrophica WOR_2 bacterium RIFOXYB2_FULL_38_16]HBG60903.1 polyribonucleotide nucleotidyltransferase [Candidatus Omnitrophota bacte
MSKVSAEIPFGGKNIIIETGKLAKQANASVTVTLGGTVVLVAVCMSKKSNPDGGFFPLVVEYQEKTYSAGRIPGGFFKREGRPTQKEILTCRIIDRPIRPLFPEGFFNDVVVTATVLSSDGENDPDMLALIGTSTALTISDIPFSGPLGAMRLSVVDGEFIINPTYEQRLKGKMELVVVGLEDGIVMIEGEAIEASEEKVGEALKFATKHIQPIRIAQIELREKIGKEKATVELFNPHPGLKNKVAEMVKGRVVEIYKIADKQAREDGLSKIHNDILSDMGVFEAFKVGDKEVSVGDIMMMFDQVEYDVVRKAIFEEGKRADGRGIKDIRELTSEINILPRTHGSGLFTRGQTQSLAVVTLGSRRDEQMIESLEGVEYNNFMLHYNFPGFSVGEAKGSRGPGRREIGHGALAAKAIKAVLPSKDDFPYTIRVVSEILESNGSSSMASVCAGCLSLMAAGVPIKNPVAGISIGLLLGENKKEYRLLTDIMGLEDHFGDMDYKIAGSRVGVTAIQLDMKVKGVPVEILIEGITQAKEARAAILDNMESVISKPMAEISEFAPRILITQVPVDKIGEIIGPGGKMIKKIIEMTGAESIDINDEGQVHIAAVDRNAAQRALDYVNGIVAVPEIGKIYDAVVVKVMNFGAFCEFMPGKQGLVHVSEFSNDFVKDIESVVKVGDTFKVKLLEIDKMKRMNLSKKQAEADS